MKVYGITYTGMQLHQLKLFNTQMTARHELEKLANERKHRMGVDCWEQDKDQFKFIFGWEEAEICFRIVEFEVWSG